jgi:type VI secretion system protein ImpA
MKPIDTGLLAAPVVGDSPGGPDLEYDQAFLALEEAVRTEPEQQFGDTIVPAEEPDWDKVRDLAVSVLERSKDLRAAVYLLEALTQGNGLAGLGQGLALIRSLLERLWEPLHPQLDPDDGLDPTARVNLVASVCDARLLKAVRTSPMLTVPGLGGISLRDLQIARGELPAPEGEEPLKLDSLDAAARDVELPTLESTAALVSAAVEDTNAIERTLTEKVGASQAVSLSALTDVLREIDLFLRHQLDARVGPEAASAGVEGDASPQVGEASPGLRTVQGGSGEISCSRDVIVTLDKIIDYYRANEPSSPVPLLLQRAKRLVSVGFIDILRDIAPDALAQAEMVTGASVEEKE